MKIRNGFVSNSSSSSFIITNKENIDKAKELINSDEYIADYYELNGKLYTSYISDCTELYGKISELAEYDNYGTMCGEPYTLYDESNYGYIQLEGERGCKTVYINQQNIGLTYAVFYSIKNIIKNIIKKIKRCLYEIKKWLCK